MVHCTDEEREAQSGEVTPRLAELSPWCSTVQTACGLSLPLLTLSALRTCVCPGPTQPAPQPGHVGLGSLSSICVQSGA